MKERINISKRLSPVSSSSLSASSATPVGTWRQPWPASRPWKIHQALWFPSRSPRSSPASQTPDTICIFFSYFQWFAHLLVLGLQRFNWIIFLQISHGGRLNPEKSHFTKKKSHMLNNLAVVAPVEVWDTLDEENSENFRSKPPGPRPIEECLKDSMIGITSVIQTFQTHCFFCFLPQKSRLPDLSQDLAHSLAQCFPPAGDSKELKIYIW